MKEPVPSSPVETIASDPLPKPIVIPSGFIPSDDDSLPSQHDAADVGVMGAMRDPLNYRITIARIPGPGSGVLDLATTFAFYPGVKEQFLTHPVVPFDRTKGVHYRVGDVPGVGKGLFSTVHPL